MRSIYQRLDAEIERCRRFDRPVCVVMMDMDHFKNVNDGHDHLFGSFVISEVGRIIKSTVRSIDIAARYGGDEFLIALTETNEAGASQFCERLRKQIEKTQFVNGKDKIKKTVSLGFAIIEPFDKVTDAKTLVRTADHALYQAKGAGRNCFRSIKITPDQKKTKNPAAQRRVS
jgi:diguanylate cyclase (GGDEF)-like protein